MMVECPQGDEIGKFRGIIGAFPHIWGDRVLDIGCRSRNLGVVLKQAQPNALYCGLDLYPPADIVANLEKGLPFKDKSFDVVVALDVLEHTDDIHASFLECCRVAARFVAITLPNAYELRGRLKFLMGMPLSGKYGLPINPPSDRHRWLFSWKEAKSFVHALSARVGFKVVADGCLIGPRRARLMGWLVKRFPNLFSPSYFALLERQGDGK